MQAAARWPNLIKRALSSAEAKPAIPALTGLACRERV
jgi:hypothetical protein